MLKADILKQTKKEGVVVTGNQLRRYIEHGLIASKKESKGYKKGVVTHYPSNSLEIIKRIQFLQNQAYSSAKEIIFLLFCEGYLVNIDKLKQNLVDYVQHLRKDLDFLANLSTDEKQYAVDEYSQTFLPKNNSGRPSSEASKKIEERKQQKRLKIKNVIQFLSDITHQNRIVNHSALSLLKSIGYSKDTIEIKIADGWIDLDNWKVSILKSSYDDFQTTQHIMLLLREYINYFSVHTDSNFYKAIFMPIKITYSNTGFKSLFQEISLIKLLLILLLTDSEQRNSFFNLLSLQGNVTSPKEVDMVLPQLLTALDQVMGRADIIE